MRTNTLNSLQSILPVALPVSVKIILLLLALLYGIFNFSAHHWILLGLVVVAIMAILERISRLNTAHKPNTANNQRVVNTDGGSFSRLEQSSKHHSAHPVVQDGGIFNRKYQK